MIAQMIVLSISWFLGLVYALGGREDSQRNSGAIICAGTIVAIGMIYFGAGV